MTEPELDRRHYAVELLKRTELKDDWASMPGIIALTARLVDLIEGDIGDWLEARATGVLSTAPRSAEVLRTVGRAIVRGDARRHQRQPDAASSSDAVGSGEAPPAAAPALGEAS